MKSNFLSIVGEGAGMTALVSLLWVKFYAGWCTVAAMKIRAVVVFLFVACFLAGGCVTEEKGYTPVPKKQTTTTTANSEATKKQQTSEVPLPPPETKPALSAAENETTQKDEYEKALEKREATLDRAMNILNTSIMVFGGGTAIWTILLTAVGIIISVFGYKWWKEFKTLKQDLSTAVMQAKSDAAALGPIVRKIKEVAKEVEAAQQSIVGVPEMMAGKEEKPSLEVKANLDDLAKKIDFLESFGAELKPEDYLSKGISFYWNKDYEKALLAFDRAIKGNEKLANAWNLKGFTLNNLKRYEEALAAVEKTLTLNPNDGNAWNLKGRSLAGLKKIDDAKEAFKKASIFSDDPAYKAYSDACFCYLEGKREDALAALGKAIELDEKNKERALRNVEVFGPLFDDPDFKKLTRIGVGKAFASPPSEPYRRVSRIRLSSQWLPLRD